ncbi:helicase-related protein (plasmid) [Alkalihalophilus sp. As8PL]|uniref:Helicase-related protein n=1 Tax=Alkalihalophilus sp. As8PL TaxID=3237103 RepID=A0AB39BMZ6_9BACI
MKNQRLTMRGMDRHVDSVLHVMVIDRDENHTNRVVFASHMGLPEEVIAVNAGFLEGRPLFLNNTEYERYHSEAYKRKERKIGEGDTVHGVLYNSLTRIEGVEEQVVDPSKESNKAFIVSTEGNIAECVSRHVINRFGLPKEWSEHYYTLFDDYIQPLDIIRNEDYMTVWPELKAVRLNAAESDVIDIMNRSLAEGVLTIPSTHLEGAFSPEWTMKEYMVNNSDIFAKMLSELKPQHNVGDPIDPAIATLKRIPFPAQANLIQAIVNTLDDEDSVICSGDMGTGKSLITTAVARILQAKRERNLRMVPSGQKKKSRKGLAVLLSAPGITLPKWKTKEILGTLPNAKVTIIKSADEMMKLYQKIKAGYEPTGLEFFLIGIDKAKRGNELFFSGVWKAIHEQGETQEFGWFCPDCGRRLHKKVEGGIEPLDWEDVADGVPPTADAISDARFEKKLLPNGLIQDEKVKWKSTKKVTTCTNHVGFYGEKYHEEKEEFIEDELSSKRLKWKALGVKDMSDKEDAFVEKGSFNCQSKLYRPALRSRGETRNKPVVMIAEVLKKCNGWFDLLVMDEVHQCKADGTGRGYAFAQMVKAAKKNLLLTGTLTNGKSSSIKEILWRTDAKSLLAAGVNAKTGSITWAERYGKLKQVVKFEEGHESGVHTRQKRKPYAPKEEPGIAPQMTSQFLLHKACFLELGDMGLPLVELKEEPIFVDMDPEHQAYYRLFHDELFDHCSLAARMGAKGAFSKFIPSTINYGDRPDFGASVQFKGTGEAEGKVISAPILEGKHAKERRMLKLVKKELSEGRRAVIFTNYSGKYGINERIKELLDEEGIHSEILTTAIGTDKRQEKLDQLKENEVPVVICNMGLVEVGLDLLYWPTIIYYQLNYEVSKIRQSSRRAWRIGQEKECRVYYLVYNGTQQMAQFLTIMSARGHALMTEGRLDKGELAKYSRDEVSSLASDLAACFATSDVATAWKELAAKDMENVETVSEGSFKDVLQNRMKSLANQTLRMAGVESQELESVSIKEQIITWIEASVTSSVSKRFALNHIDAILARIDEGLSGFTVIDDQLQVDLIDAFGFAMVPDAEIVAYLTNNRSQVEERKKHTGIKLVASNHTGKGKKKLSDGQLAFDLFGDM